MEGAAAAEQRMVLLIVAAAVVAVAVLLLFGFKLLALLRTQSALAELAQQHQIRLALLEAALN